VYFMHIKGEFGLHIVGLYFIGSKFSSIKDKKLQSPIGFNIIFPGMIGYATGMGLDLPMCQSDVDDMFYLRESELKRYEPHLICLTTY